MSYRKFLLLVATLSSPVATISYGDTFTVSTTADPGTGSMATDLQPKTGRLIQRIRRQKPQVFKFDTSILIRDRLVGIESLIYRIPELLQDRCSWTRKAHSSDWESLAGLGGRVTRNHLSKPR